MTDYELAWCPRCRRFVRAETRLDRCLTCGAYVEIDYPEQGIADTNYIAAVAGVERQTAGLWCRQGLFPNAFKSGGRWFVPAGDLEGFDPPKAGYPKGRPRKPRLIGRN